MKRKAQGRWDGDEIDASGLYDVNEREAYNESYAARGEAEIAEADAEIKKDGRAEASRAALLGVPAVLSLVCLAAAAFAMVYFLYF